MNRRDLIAGMLSLPFLPGTNKPLHIPQSTMRELFQHGPAIHTDTPSHCIVLDFNNDDSSVGMNDWICPEDSISNIKYLARRQRDRIAQIAFLPGGVGSGGDTIDIVLGCSPYRYYLDDDSRFCSSTDDCVLSLLPSEFQHAMRTMYSIPDGCYLYCHQWHYCLARAGSSTYDENCACCDCTNDRLDATGKLS